MKTSCWFASLALLVLTGFGTVQAEEKVLATGDPPLTQSMVDDYCHYLAWRNPQALENAGGPQRIGQMVVNDWKNGDKARQKAVLADLKWWRENGPRITAAERDRQPIRDPAPATDPRVLARNQEAIHLLTLQQLNDARQQQLRALSNLQACHHETMMVIINNVRPSGRYEYNPATGRYDRYVPYSR
jgi:hypothetical protein